MESHLMERRSPASLVNLKVPRWRRGAALQVGDDTILAKNIRLHGEYAFDVKTDTDTDYDDLGVSIRLRSQPQPLLLIKGPRPLGACGASFFIEDMILICVFINKYHHSLTKNIKADPISCIENHLNIDCIEYSPSP